MGWKKYLKYIDPVSSLAVDKPEEGGVKGYIKHFTPFVSKAMELAEKSIDQPTILDTPDPPDMEDEDVKKAEEEEKTKLRRMRGRQSTILTSGLGASGKPFTLRKTLLGGG